MRSIIDGRCVGHGKFIRFPKIWFPLQRRLKTFHVSKSGRRSLIRALTLLLLLWAMPVQAHDGTHDEWFRSLTNKFGGSCCNMTDCKPVVARIRADGQWEAFVDSKTWPEIDGDVLHLHGAAPNDWVTIPDGVVLHGHNNPTGEPVLCFYQGSPLCFVPGVEI